MPGRRAQSPRLRHTLRRHRQAVARHRAGATIGGKPCRAHNRTVSPIRQPTGRDRRNVPGRATTVAALTTIAAAAFARRFGSGVADGDRLGQISLSVIGANLFCVGGTGCCRPFTAASRSLPALCVRARFFRCRW